MGTKTIGIFSLSKVENFNILVSWPFILLRNKLKSNYGINLFIPGNIFDYIEGKSPKYRAEQLHSLLKNKNIDFLWALTWWSASNEVLEYLNYDLIKKYNKPIIWYSDLTVLINAIYNRTWIINFLWPNLKTILKNYKYNNYSLEYFRNILKNNISKIDLDFKKSIFDPSVNLNISNSNLIILKKWKASGICIWWNLSSICLLFWTKYFDSLENKILFIEECDEFSIWLIRRNLFQLRYIRWFNKISWVVFWFINKSCFRKYNYTLDKTILDVFWDLNIPIIRNALIWHISPIQTIPIWWKGEIDTYNNNYFIKY